MEFYKSGVSSGTDNHYHVVMRHVEMEPQIDPRTGQPAIDPQTGQPLPPQEVYRYECGEVRGHVHEVIELEDGSFQLGVGEDGHVHVGMEPCRDKFPKRPEREDSDVVKRVYQLHEAAYKHDKESIEKGKESDKFYKGEQWDKGVKQQLESDGRAALTINVTQKVIDDLVGYQRQQRSDVRAQPIGETDQAVCDVVNVMLKVIQEQSQYQFKESRVVEDAAICGRGNFSVGISTLEDIRGDIKIEAFPFEQVFYGPHLELDGSDVEYITKSQMWSLSKIKARYPKKASEVSQGHGALLDTHQRFSSSGNSYAGDDYDFADFENTPLFSAGSMNIDVVKKEIKVIELEEKIYVPVVIFYNAATEETYSSFGWKSSEVKQVERMPNMYVIEQEVQKMRIVKVAGSTLLSDEYVADRPSNDFSVIPVYCKKRGKDFWGIVESVKDAQREFNKRLSQAVDAMNFSMNHLYQYDETTFETETDRKQFLENATKPGAVVKVANSDRGIRVLQTTRMPSAELGSGEAYENRIYALAGIDATRHAGANTSATAIMQAEKSKLVGREYLFRNVFEAKKRLAKQIIAYIQEYYSGERIYEIIADRNAKEPIEINGNPFDQIQREAIIQLIESQDLTKVDLVIDEIAWSPTHRLATFAALSEMLSKGAPIPFEILVPLMDVPETYKQQIVQAIMQQQQAQAEAAKAQADSEVEKTLIARNIITPPIAEKYQIPLPGGGIPPGVGQPQ